MRSEGSWGIGDLVDLADLAAWSGHAEGADFVLVNPLHAASPAAPMEPSPYLPVTRRFANPIYLRVESIEEYASLSMDDRARIEALTIPVRALSTSPDLIDRDVIWEAKSQALRYPVRCAALAGPPGPVRRVRRARGPGPDRLRHLVRAGRRARWRADAVAGCPAGRRLPGGGRRA